MTKDEITNSAKRHADDLGLFVTGVTIQPGNEVEVLVDSEGAVSIDACAALSRAIEADFDREAEDFSLTVASAGIGEPLVDLRQYLKLTGRPVEVLLKNGTKILATLEAADADSVTLCYEQLKTTEKKRKEKVQITERYPLSEIKHTKEYLDFK